MERALVWFRNDLRLADHMPLASAAKASHLLCAYVVPARFFATDPLGFPRVGHRRRQFLAESLVCLQHELGKQGQHLWLLKGNPAEVLPKLAKDLQAEHIYAYRYPGTEELRDEQALERQFPVSWFWGNTLVHPDDLGFELARLPKVFTDFRKKLEAALTIRAPIPVPRLPPPIGNTAAVNDPGALLELEKLSPDPRAVMPFSGGSVAGHERLKYYLWESNAIATYHETRNGLLGADYSSKLSPWLALGCLSPREVYSELKRYEIARVANQSTYWLFFELLWRDFFQWALLRHQSKLFRVSGILEKRVSWENDLEAFAKWRCGQTGLPFADANLRELAATGWMSNRGRQNVAAFLAKSLRVNWTWGARWFESQLIDYDVGSNWGNWNYTSGVGNDPRPNRWFDVSKQGAMYDPQGTYTARWLNPRQP